MKKKNFTVIERTPERTELMQLMISDDIAVASQSQLAFAKVLRELVQRLLDQKPIVNTIFRKESFQKGSTPTIFVDPYESYREGDFFVWSTTKAGGLHTQTVEGLTEYPFGWHNLDSALFLEGDYIRESRLDLMAKAVNRLTQEFVAQEERMGWTAILTALASGTNTQGKNHTINATTAGRLQIDDFNRLKVLVTRLYQSFAQGSITDDHGLTDMYLSPERMADIRSLSYQPVNTYGIPNSDESTVLGLPDKVREEIYRSAGMARIWDVDLHELRELGLGRKLNVIFDQVSTNAPTYDNATQDLVIGMDLSQDTCISPVRSDDAGNTVIVKPDNQFLYNRTDRVGWTFHKSTSYCVIDNRWIVGMIV